MSISLRRNASHICLAVAALLVPLVYFLMVKGLPILETHAFRQTQTAITAYWMVKEGWSLDYITPILGQPWSVPFEFPTFQMIVSAIVRLTGAGLDVTGRGVSLFFSILTVVPACALVNLLSGDRRAGLALTVLYCTTPLYVFWGSTFMIQSTALFFTLSSMLAALWFLRSGLTRHFALFILLGTLAGLTKITVYAPPAGILTLHVLLRLREPAVLSGAFRLSEPGRRHLLMLAGVAITMGLSYVWVVHTDHVKQLNPLGDGLTSAHLTRWNLGTFAQRFSADMLNFALRLLSGNAGVALGLFVVAIRMIHLDRARRAVVAALTAPFLLHVMTFTNLNVVHDYYQTENLIYLLAGIAVGLLPSPAEKATASAFWIAGVVALNAASCMLPGSYAAVAIHAPGPAARRTLEVAHFVAQHTAETDALVVFGYDWSSEVHYYAGRKGVAVPAWVDWATVGSEKELRKRMPGQNIGAIVVCQGPMPTPSAEEASLELDRKYTAHKVAGCDVLLPVDAATPAAP